MTDLSASMLRGEIEKFSRRHGLTQREREIMTLLVEGCGSVPRIAGRLELSPNTVHNHFKNIFKRTRTNSKTTLLSLFIDGAMEQKAEPEVRMPRVLLLEPDEAYLEHTVRNLTRIRMQAFVETRAARLLDRVRDLQIDAVIANGRRHSIDDTSPVGLLATLYEGHPALLFADHGRERDQSGLVGVDVYVLPDELDRLALTILRHSADHGYLRPRMRRVSTSLLARVNDESMVRVANLSAGGALLLGDPRDLGLGQEPNPGARLSLQLGLDDPGPLPLQAEVAWFRKSLDEEEPCRIGVRFLTVDESTRDLLVDTVKAQVRRAG
jgi:DNA-binding CsgD family transcriptional regulator